MTIGSEDLKANHMIQQIFEFPQEYDKYNLLVCPPHADRMSESISCSAAAHSIHVAVRMQALCPHLHLLQ